MKKVLLFLCALVAAQMANAWYLVGIGGDWSTFHEPTKTEGNNQYWENIELGASEEFKITSQANFDGENLGNYGYHDGHMLAVASLTAGNNATWNGTAGTYTFEFNTSTKYLNITKVADAVTETLTYNVTVPDGTPACYIAGEMNGWSFTAMTKVDDTHYTITYDNVMKSTQYKYTCGEDWIYEEQIGANRTYTANDVVTAWKALPTEPKETLTYNVTVPEGTPACYIAGGMNGWSFTAMTKVDETHYTISYDNVMKSMEYKYTCGDSWDYVEVIGGNRTYSENDVVTAWTKVIYNENITYNNSYLLNIEATDVNWEADGAKFGAWFYNKNMPENNAVLVQGAKLQENVILFYLDENHVKDFLGEAINFTHVVFLRLNPEVEYTFANTWPGDANVWNRVETYCPGPNMYFQLTGMEAGTWKELDPNATGVNRVELAEGIGYAYGVVSAEGAIEVYNVNGAVVARGNDNVDLRGLGRGVYIIRNGNQVRKVVR